MKKTPWFLKSLLAISILAISGCNTSPVYSTFQPQAESFIQIKFEYPSNWNWDTVRPNEISIYNTGNFSSFSIFVWRFENTKEMKDYLKKRIQGSFDFGVDRDAVFLYEPITLDGYPAKRIVLDLPINPHDEERIKPTIQEKYFLLVDNTVYELLFNIETDQRNGEFGRAFDHIIETLQVLDEPSVP